MSQPLFGLVPAGQPAIISPTEAPSPTSFLYAIPPTNPNGPSKPFGHVVVFLLPGVVLPPGTAAAIYLVTPPSAALGQTVPNLKFLGGIGPGKESAIFKVGPGSTGGNVAQENVVIGVSVEDAESVASRMSSSGTAAGTAGTGVGGTGGSGALVPVSAARQQPSTLVLAQRIIKNAFNFLSSFTGSTPGQMEVVPLKAFEEWWKKFESKVRTDPGFLENDDDQ
ncbi:hypothetical protein QBC32DRAFT_57335 [Pseudoneurospora amorphoporcata]|uniref:Hikeshi-like domain-containing protein n=1 Tax=Pseudoneurospora amorphoporcata TaxID=241081 RepID=A0AAN6SJB0_9PEZI|nr:hypothetical protein QBC32DRAFT_57335 [Pseudoneurospora amorphoporcata]